MRRASFARWKQPLGNTPQHGTDKAPIGKDVAFKGLLHACVRKEVIRDLERPPAVVHKQVGDVQAKELLDHLEGVLSNEPVEVVAGNSIVEVKPQGVSKGAVVDRLLTELADKRAADGSLSSPDFVLCIGDDRSDEDMFTAVEHVTFNANANQPDEVGAPSPLPHMALPCLSMLLPYCSLQCQGPHIGYEIEPN